MQVILHGYVQHRVRMGNRETTSEMQQAGDVQQLPRDSGELAGFLLRFVLLLPASPGSLHQ